MHTLTPHASRDFSIVDYIPGEPIPLLVRDPLSGKVVVNELKRYVKPYTLVTDPALITLAGDAVSDPIPLVIDGKGHFEIFDAFFVSQRTEGFTVMLFEAEDRPFLMNREIHVATIASGGGVTTKFDGALGVAGSPGRPFRWPETLFLDVSKGARAIFAVFRNLSSSQNQIRFCLHGRRWMHLQAAADKNWRVLRRMEEIFRERARSFPFFYTTDAFASLVAGEGPTNFNVRFGDDSWTEWVKGMSVQDQRWNVRIVETATGKRFMELATQDNLVFGNGELPFLLWESSLFEPGYQLTFELTNGSGTLPNTIWITLACRKILWDPHEDELRRPGEPAGV